MYPETLLPRRGMAAPVICDDSYFVRAVNQNVKDFYNSNQQAFDPGGIIEEILKPNGEREVYSLSLFFNDISLSINEISAIPKNKSLFDFWDGNEEIDATSIEYDVKIRYPVFLKGVVLNGLSTPVKNENGYDNISTKVSHAPTRSNFLHYQLSVFKNDEMQPLHSGKTSIKKRIAQAVCENILYTELRVIT